MAKLAISQNVTVKFYFTILFIENAAALLNIHISNMPSDFFWFHTLFYGVAKLAIFSKNEFLLLRGYCGNQVNISNQLPN